MYGATGNRLRGRAGWTGCLQGKQGGTRGAFQSTLNAAQQPQSNTDTLSFTTLKGADLAMLGERFPLEHMSREQYDEFLTCLQEKGVLTEDDLALLGYGGKMTRAGAGSYMMPNEYCYNSLDSAKGNLRLYARSMASITNIQLNDGRRDTDMERRIVLFQKITDILDQIPTQK